MTPSDQGQQRRQMKKFLNGRKWVFHHMYRMDNPASKHPRVSKWTNATFKAMLRISEIDERNRPQLKAKLGVATRLNKPATEILQRHT